MDNSEKDLELEGKIEQTTEINQDKKDIEDFIKEINKQIKELHEEGLLKKKDE